MTVRPKEVIEMAEEHGWNLEQHQEWIKLLIFTKKTLVRDSYHSLAPYVHIPELVPPCLDFIL